MQSERLVKEWFSKWRQGDYMDLPLHVDFKHTSPFGTISGKSAYLALIADNKEKFLGYAFDLHDAIYETDRACVRYTARQGKEFRLYVSEWYYFKDNLIGEIIAYYHIGEIQEGRKLKG